jgi:hypothetical protein
VIEGELGQPLETVFSKFDEIPIGCASIGQAHRAVLRSTSERVVVKVQNPEAERTFRGDVFALKVIVDMFAPQVVWAWTYCIRKGAQLHVVVTPGCRSEFQDCGACHHIQGDRVRTARKHEARARDPELEPRALAPPGVARV